MKIKIILTVLSLSIMSGCGVLRDITHPDRNDIVASRVNLVDHYTEGENNNFLFRGSDPVLRSNEFAYDELVSLMKVAAEREGVTLPDDFYLIDVSLLFVERADLSVERKYFKQNPTQGEFVNYPVFGHVGGNRFERVIHIADKSTNFLAQFLAYPIFGRLERIFKTVETAEQDLTNLDIKAVTGLRGFLTQKREKPTVIYVHCVAGCDRTGEIVGAYRMQYKNQEIQAVFDKNTQECGRDENVFSVDSLQAYCRYLGRGNCDIN